MATGKNIDGQPIDPEIEKRWQLMRRDDLASVVGVAFHVPFHGEDESGQWRYGLSPIGGTKNPEIAAEFEHEMRQIVVASALPLLEAGILSEAQLRAIRGHPYETGPAAGDWWQFFFEIYKQVDPLISRAADLIAIAVAIKQAAAGARDWKQRKQEEIERKHGASVDPTGPHSLDPQLVLTLPALVALCYDDLVQRHGEQGDVAVTVYPRNRWAGYGSADHLSGGENYVIRLAAGSRKYFCLSDGSGSVYEHYRTEDDDLVMLTIPDLLPDDYSGNPYRQP